MLNRSASPFSIRRPQNGRTSRSSFHGVNFEMHSAQRTLDDCALLMGAIVPFHSKSTIWTVTALPMSSRFNSLLTRKKHVRSFSRQKGIALRHHMVRFALMQRTIRESPVGLSRSTMTMDLERSDAMAIIRLMVWDGNRR